MIFHQEAKLKPVTELHSLSSSNNINHLQPSKENPTQDPKSLRHGSFFINTSPEHHTTVRNIGAGRPAASVLALRLEGEGADGEDREGEIADHDGLLGLEDGAGRAAVEGGGLLARGERRRDEGHLALVEGVGGNGLGRHEEEVAVLVGLGRLHRGPVLGVVAFQLHDGTCKDTTFRR